MLYYSMPKSNLRKMSSEDYLIVNSVGVKRLAFSTVSIVSIMSKLEKEG